MLESWDGTEADGADVLDAATMIAELARLLPDMSWSWEQTGGNTGTIIGQDGAYGLLVGPGCYSAGTLDGWDLSASWDVAYGDLPGEWWEWDGTGGVQGAAADLVRWLDR
jgi:hypothetical protein